MTAPSTLSAVHRNSYRDSVELMGIAAELERQPGVLRAGLVMATPANRAVLAGAGLLEAVPAEAGPNDLVVAVAADSPDAAEAAIARAGTMLASAEGDSGGAGRPARDEAPHTLAEAAGALAGANIAVVSTPGTYATAEALKALKRGLSVFLFSDNVSLRDEIELKALATRKGLLVMGPDCGTAIVGGVPLGFANAVRRGPIGLVGASGTGLQEVSSLIHRLGGGVSHALGTGGRDLDERVGGATMRAAVELLLADEATRVLVIISKPPSPAVAAAVLDLVRGSAKPVVVDFLGGEPGPVLAVGAHFAVTFEAAALMATALARGEVPDEALAAAGLDADLAAVAATAASGLGGGATRIRGLFSGGSLASEARLLLRGALGPDRRDTVLDLGDDEYTVGRPHPMIDPRLRLEQIAAAAADPEVGLLLLDVVLGYASDPDPAASLAPAVREAREAAGRAGRGLAVVASVCGTDDDPQGFARTSGALAGAGALLAPSNARAALLAARIVQLAEGGSAAGAPR